MKFGKQLELIKVVEKLGNGKEFRSDTDFGIKEVISQHNFCYLQQKLQNITQLNFRIIKMILETFCKN